MSDMEEWELRHDAGLPEEMRFGTPEYWKRILQIQNQDASALAKAIGERDALNKLLTEALAANTSAIAQWEVCQKERDALKAALQDAVDDLNAYASAMRIKPSTLESYYTAPQAEPEAKA